MESGGHRRSMKKWWDLKNLLFVTFSDILVAPAFKLCTRTMWFPLNVSLKLCQQTRTSLFQELACSFVCAVLFYFFCERCNIRAPTRLCVGVLKQPWTNTFQRDETTRKKTITKEAKHFTHVPTLICNLKRHVRLGFGLLIQLTDCQDSLLPALLFLKVSYRDSRGLKRLQWCVPFFSAMVADVAQFYHQDLLQGGRP